MRKYGCDVAFSPMIVSESFTKSQKARDAEFSTCEGGYTTMPTSPITRTHAHTLADRPLVVQFAASNAEDFARAAEMVAPYADAVDLNCGCPQR